MPKPCQDRSLHPILVCLRKNKKNMGSQMGQTDKKTTFKNNVTMDAPGMNTDNVLTFSD
jgi:hypothetical protein